MKVTIAAIGRLKDGAERVLVERYRERLVLGRGLGIGPVGEAEAPESRKQTAGERMAEEAARLMRGAGDADLLVALAPDGRGMTSEAFAAWLAARRDSGARHLAFLIGGADGLGAEARCRAALALSLGPMTLPHGLARVMLAEQLYRAVTILCGHPYHRQ